MALATDWLFKHTLPVAVYQGCGRSALLFARGCPPGPKWAGCCGVCVCGENLKESVYLFKLWNEAIWALCFFCPKLVKGWALWWPRGLVVAIWPYCACCFALSVAGLPDKLKIMVNHGRVGIFGYLNPSGKVAGHGKGRRCCLSGVCIMEGTLLSKQAKVPRSSFWAGFFLLHWWGRGRLR